MGKKAIFALAALSCLPMLASALEIKNIRVTHGPLGATRTDTKFLPGDYLFMSFDLDGLTFNPKDGKATYETVLELYNSDNPPKKIFKKETTNTVAPMLGGGRIPGDLHVIMGTEQPPGRLVVRLIVIDKLAPPGPNQFKHFDYRFELLPQGFGLVGATAPAVGFPGQHYVASFALVNMKLDKQSNPNVKVTMRVLDALGQQELTRPIYTLLPKDMPKGIMLDKENFIPMQFPIYLNRPGRFTIDIEAVDLTSNATSRLRYMLNVMDLDNIISR